MERDVVDRAYDEPRSVTQLERNGYFCVDAAGSPAVPPQRLARRSIGLESVRSFEGRVRRQEAQVSGEINAAQEEEKRS